MALRAHVLDDSGIARADKLLLGGGRRHFYARNQSRPRRRVTQQIALENTRARLRFPDFVCIGAQKAGTTWLYRNLRAHPEVWLPPVKELHYFDQLYVDTPGHQQAADEHRRARAKRAIAQLRSESEEDAPSVDLRAASAIATGVVSDDWYGSLFALAPGSAVCGEITGSYALLPDEGVDHLVRLSPDVKILLLVRDPIDRAWSHVQMLHRKGSPHRQRQFEPAPILELDSRVLSRSRYSTTLDTYRRRIGADSIWIGDFDRLTGEPTALLRDVCAFLDVDFDQEMFPYVHRRIHEGLPREMEGQAYERLKAALAPEYDELMNILPEAAARWRARHFG